MFKVFLLPLFLASVAVPPRGQDSALAPGTIPKNLTLDEALEIFRERNPLLLAARQREFAARGDLEQAGKTLNPVFALDTEELTKLGNSTGSTNLFLSISQEIEIGGKIKWRKRVAESLLSAASNDYLAFERALSFELKRTHAQLILAQSNFKLSGQILADFDGIIRLSRIRYERGEMAGGELRRVESERLAFLEDQVAAEIAIESARAELLGLLGMPGYTGTFEATPPSRLGGELQDMTTLISEAVKTRFELRAQNSRKEAAVRQIELQKAVWVPNVAPFVTYQKIRGLNDRPDDNFLNFGVSVGIPLLNRNPGGVARARAESRREEELARAVRYQIAVEVRTARQRLASEQKRIRFFEDTYLDTTRQARDISEAAYRMGGETLINFLDASRVYRATLQSYYRAIFDLGVARYQLELALGKELS